ncbi:response regulator protein [Burkholderia aenigmatica]|uniref:Response regulator protein n=1 Tax=Burkholderia aenigmatica TaxID=2015348 RepID=A0ABY6XQF7_9BURK|nr:response regulator protein [Burkholderia aenigmatica]
MNENPLKYRVLLIEDDDRLAQLVREYLDGYEFAVTVVRRGDLAVAAVREHQPALVILDLMLPNLDGMEVCRRIRAFTNVPVLILTARADVYDQVAGLETGADDYVTKPIEPRVLVARACAVRSRPPPKRPWPRPKRSCSANWRSRRRTVPSRGAASRST